MERQPVSMLQHFENRVCSLHWSDPVLRNVLHVHISAAATHLLNRLHPWAWLCGPVERSRGAKR